MSPACRTDSGGGDRPTVTDALRRFLVPFRWRHTLPAHEDRTLDWLVACQTPALGARMLSCGCGWSAPVFTS